MTGVNPKYKDLVNLNTKGLLNIDYSYFSPLVKLLKSFIKGKIFVDSDPRIIDACSEHEIRIALNEEKPICEKLILLGDDKLNGGEFSQCLIVTYKNSDYQDTFNPVTEIENASFERCLILSTVHQSFDNCVFNDNTFVPSINSKLYFSDSQFYKYNSVFLKKGVYLLFNRCQEVTNFSASNKITLIASKKAGSTHLANCEFRNVYFELINKHKKLDIALSNVAGIKGEVDNLLLSDMAVEDVSMLDIRKSLFMDCPKFSRNDYKEIALRCSGNNGDIVNITIDGNPAIQTYTLKSGGNSLICIPAIDYISENYITSNIGVMGNNFMKFINMLEDGIKNVYNEGGDTLLLRRLLKYLKFILQDSIETEKILKEKYGKGENDENEQSDGIGEKGSC